jgi:hypothetical protein
MPFATNAFIRYNLEGRPLHVTNIFRYRGWRYMLYFRANQRSLMITLKLIYYVLWLGFRVLGIMSSWCGLGGRDIARTYDITDFALVCELKLPCVNQSTLLRS